MATYRVWLSEKEMLFVEVEAASLEDARVKIDGKIYERTLWEEPSVQIGEGRLEVESVGLVE